MRQGDNARRVAWHIRALATPYHCDFNLLFFQAAFGYGNLGNRTSV
ncbi:hypothetical protein [Kingella negevensis]|nr:hypothetical protein [Kingella negevensis]MDK4679503.1 hypothetical protein [Kingella negevensis]MDK4682779.1 hypothetical protein [Kingella negevensis]MDK4689320.1 hypothetical protein [Kingella negevensis]MDK4690976.1 hypothetical protein [Kingella negevensis]MDK4693877.1 hypothetical protein [Kingella negevensis]